MYHVFTLGGPANGGWKIGASPAPSVGSEAVEPMTAGIASRSVVKASAV